MSQRTGSIAAAMVACIACGGCSFNGPWDEGGASYSRAEMERSNAPVGVIVGTFTTPSSLPIEWRNLGGVLSDAVRTNMAERRDLKTLTDATAATDVQRAFAGRASDLPTALGAIQRRHPDIRYVIIGTVTEFRHASIPLETPVKNGSSRNRAQAVAAMTMEIIDLNQRRSISTQRLEANAWVDQPSAADAYRSISMGSQRFWDTPLGLASRDLVKQCADRFNHFVPANGETPIRIVDGIGGRRVRLFSDAYTQAPAGAELYVCVYDRGGTQLQSVPDRVTGLPLKAKIESRGVSPSAWLMGEPSADVRLDRAVLTRSLPKP